MISYNKKLQKKIAAVVLVIFTLINLATPIIAYAQAAPDVGTIGPATIDVGDLQPVGASPNITSEEEARIYSDAGLGGPVIKPQEAVGEIATTIQKGEDLCKDIKGSIGQVALQIGVKIGTELLKNAAKTIGKAIGKTIWKNLDSFIPGAKAALSKIGSIFGFGKKGPQKVAIEKGGPLEDLQKKLINKECLLKPFVRSMSTMMIKSLTTSVVTWIQGYDPNTGRSNVGFVGNFKQSLRQELDSAGGQFINKLTEVNLCGGVGFQRFLKFRLQTPYSYPDQGYGLNNQLGCTATDIVRQVKYDYASLQNNFAGGWPAFIKYSLEPQNNPYGAYLIALDAKVLAENSAGQAFQQGFTAGGGFLGFTTDEYTNCQAVGEDSRAYYNKLKSEAVTDPNSQSLLDAAKRLGVQDKGGGKWNKCDVLRVTRTPGQTAAFMLNKVIGSGIDQAGVATEMDNLIAATIKATINRIIAGSSGRNKGLFDSNVGYAIDKEAVGTGGEAGTTEIDIPILGLIAKADTGLLYLDQQILQSTLNNMAANLSPVGSEQLFPGQVDPNNPQNSSSVGYFDIARDLRQGALDESRTGLLLSQADFNSYRDGLIQKQQIQNIKTQLVDKLLSMLDSGVNIQTPINQLGISGLENSLNQAIAGIPIASNITLLGTIESNLINLVKNTFDTASRASQKVISLNAINFNSLPIVRDNFEIQSKVSSLANTLNYNKSLLESSSNQLDPTKVQSMDLEEITNFLTRPDIQISIKNILDKSIQIDEDIKNVLGVSLAVPQDQLISTSTPIDIPSSGTGSPGFIGPDFEPHPEPISPTP